MSDLGQEWTILQNQHEQLERSGLWIKLLAFVIALVGIAVPFVAWGAVLLVAGLWLQEAIYKTFQNRLGERLLAIEQAISSGNELTPFQLHSAWEAQRPGVVGLFLEYFKNSLRPTVAFPYVFLIATTLIFLNFYQSTFAQAFGAA